MRQKYSKVFYLSLVCFLLSISFNSCSLKSIEIKNNSSKPVKDTWVNRYSIINGEKDKSSCVGKSAIETGKNTFIIAGYASDSILIQEISNSGNIINAELIILNDINASRQNIFQSLNNQIISIGNGIIETDYEDNLISAITFLKINMDDRNIVTAKKIAHDNLVASRKTSAIKDTDGNYIVCCEWKWNESDEKEQGDILLIKVNQAGEILWAKTFGGKRNDYPVTLIETTDGGAVVCGYTESFGGDFSNRRGFVLKVNAKGESVFFKLYGTWLSHTYTHPIAVTSFGYITMFTFDNGKETLLQLDKDGEVINSYSYGNNLGCYHIFSIGDKYIISCENNRLKVIGSISDNGEIGWLKAYKHNTKFTGLTVESIIKSKDDYLLVTGWEDFGLKGTKQVVMKISIDGNVSNDCQEIIKPVKIPKKLTVGKIEVEDANKYPELKQRNIDPKDFEISEIPFKCKNIKDMMIVEKVCGK